jgi:hypothetical protein
LVRFATLLSKSPDYTLPGRFFLRPSKIVKIGELADFQPIRPRCTNHLQKIKIGVRRFPALDSRRSSLDPRMEPGFWILNFSLIDPRRNPRI